MFKQDDIQPTIAGLRKDHIVQFLLEHLKNSNLHNQASVQLNAPNAHFKSNREFWERLLYERNATLKWVELKGFQIVDWFPRTPGLYHTDTENINSIYKKLQINILKLNNVQTGDNCTMSNERTINTGGGNYYESISTSGGNYIQGNYINMSQDLTQAAAQIQELIEQLQKSGLTVDSAQEKVAKDVANQAQNNPTMKDKLVKWGQSLGDATVNDVVKGAVKLAIRSAGIPLP